MSVLTRTRRVRLIALEIVEEREKEGKDAERGEGSDQNKGRETNRFLRRSNCATTTTHAQNANGGLMATRRVSWITQVWEIMKDDVPKVDEYHLNLAHEPFNGVKSVSVKS